MNQSEQKESIRVSPAKNLGGEIGVPGDKSISHRTAMFAALTTGKSRLSGFLPSGDCLATLHATEALGAKVTVEREDEIEIEGTGGVFCSPDQPLDMGNSGTGMRLLTGLLSGLDLTAQLEGDESLSKRPMNRIQLPLAQMGAQVELLGADNRPPIKIQGGGLNAIDYELPVASAQVKSAILLAGMIASGRTVVHEPRRTRDHTERIMAALGLPIEVNGLSIAIEGSRGNPLRIPGREWHIPGDFSSAAFWMTAAAAAPDSELRIRNVGLNPRRTAFLDVLKRMGAGIEILSESISNAGEPYGDLRVCGGELKGVDVGGDEIPNLIDECPLVAVAGALAEGKTTLRDAGELRVKESDRIATMCSNLSKMGVRVEEREDGMTIWGNRNNIRGDVGVASHGDHRVAMAIAILALFADSPTSIEDIGCVQTSYPMFWRDLKRLDLDYSRAKFAAGARRETRNCSN